MIQDIITYFVNNGQTYLTYVGQHLSLSINPFDARFAGYS